MNETELVSRAILVTLKKCKRATIVDVASLLDMPTGWVANHVGKLCDMSPAVRAKIGHWPQESGGFVYLQNSGRDKSKMRHGQHVMASAKIASKSAVKPPSYEIVDKLGRYLGIVPATSLVKIEN